MRCQFLRTLTTGAPEPAPGLNGGQLLRPFQHLEAVKDHEPRRSASRSPRHDGLGQIVPVQPQIASVIAVLWRKRHHAGKPRRCKIAT